MPRAKSKKTVLHKTKKYEKFNLVVGNRPLRESHIQKLMRSIREENLLSVRPILVNQKLDVIDGQHRLEAAKRLGVSIFYIMEKGIDVNQARTINRNTKTWSVTDFMHSYADLGVDSYEEYRRLKNRTNFSHHVLLRLLSTKPYKRVRKDFKQGDFVIDNKEHMEKIYKQVKDFAAFYDGTGRTSFVLAIHELNSNELYSHRRMMAKLSARCRLRDCPTTDDYKRELEAIYNINENEKITFKNA
jgi:hypothetical protein